MTGLTAYLIPIVFGFIALIILLYFIPVGLWFQAMISDVSVPLLQLVMMRWRKVPPSIIIEAMIASKKAGLRINRDELEAHYLAGGKVSMVVKAMISAEKANLDLTFNSHSY
jgi:uncharacterized protein YqfA (UPF0365 family)